MKFAGQSNAPQYVANLISQLRRSILVLEAEIRRSGGSFSEELPVVGVLRTSAVRNNKAALEPPQRKKRVAINLVNDEVVSHEDLGYHSQTEKEIPCQNKSKVVIKQQMNAQMIRRYIKIQRRTLNNKMGWLKWSF